MRHDLGLCDEFFVFGVSRERERGREKEDNQSKKEGMEKSLRERLIVFFFSAALSLSFGCFLSFSREHARERVRPLR